MTDIPTERAVEAIDNNAAPLEAMISEQFDALCEAARAAFENNREAMADAMREFGGTKK